MTQADAVREWWAGLDDVARRRVLRFADDDLVAEDLAEDLAVGLAMSGVTVVALDPSPVDGRPGGWVPPDVLLDLVVEVRRG